MDTDWFRRVQIEDQVISIARPVFDSDEKPFALPNSKVGRVTPASRSSTDSVFHNLEKSRVEFLHLTGNYCVLLTAQSEA
jgi:hypothetical protein